MLPEVIAINPCEEIKTSGFDNGAFDFTIELNEESL
jgi:hypothetical protein